MKREIISALAGAGVVGSLWAVCTFYKTPPTVPEPEIPRYVKTTAPVNRSVTGVYSALPEKKFPGLKLYENDFLIPLNRMDITEYLVFDDPKRNYGSGNMPMCAFVFRVSEKGKEHYFLTSGPQWRTISKLVYLGENVVITKAAFEGNGYYLVNCVDKKGRKGSGAVPVSYITGSDPEHTPGISQEIGLDPMLKYAEKCDPFVWKINAEKFWQIYRKAFQENDKMTVAKMISFPIYNNGEKIYTRAQFVEKFDEIFSPEQKADILKGNSSKIWYSWRGAQLPNGSWLEDACSANAPAGPITL